MSKKQSIAPWKKQLALWATLFRMLCVPIIIIVFLLKTPYWNWIAAWLSAFASVSDWLDGYWARKYHSVSDLGKFLDPIADKLLVTTQLVLLLQIGRIEILLVLLLIHRDLLINGLRSLAASEGRVIAAGSLGKWKTGLQMVGLPLLIVGYDFLWLPTYTAGYIMTWLSGILSLASAYTYIKGYLISRKSF